MTDHNYPDSYKHNDELQEYIEPYINMLRNMYLEAGTNLDKECYEEFDKQVKIWINQ